MSSSKFSSEEDEKLIDYVEKEPILYDVAHTNYRNALMKANAWIEIGKEIGRDGEYFIKYFF